MAGMSAPRIGRSSKALHDCESWRARPPPSLNKYRKLDARGPTSEPAVWYDHVAERWPNRPPDLCAVWSRETKDYQRMCDRWRTLCGDGERRVQQRKDSGPQTLKYKQEQAVRMSTKRDFTKTEKAAEKAAAHVCIQCGALLKPTAGRPYSEADCTENCPTRARGGCMCAECRRGWSCKLLVGNALSDRQLPRHFTPQLTGCPWCRQAPAKMFRPAATGSKRARV